MVVLFQPLAIAPRKRWFLNSPTPAGTRRKSGIPIQSQSRSFKFMQERQLCSLTSCGITEMPALSCLEEDLRVLYLSLICLDKEDLWVLYINRIPLVLVNLLLLHEPTSPLLLVNSQSATALLGISCSTHFVTQSQTIHIHPQPGSLPTPNPFIQDNIRVCQGCRRLLKNFDDSVPKPPFLTWHWLVLNGGPTETKQGQE